MIKLLYYILFAQLLICSHTLYAQWSTNPYNNLIVGYGLLPEIASDSSGGCYITYEQNLSYPRRLILERLNRYGYKPWGGNRRILGLLPEQASVKITEDGRGGVIVAYHDVFWGGTPHEPIIIDRLRVQRVDSSGNFLWGPTGVRVSLSETNQGDQAIVSDGQGGCIVAWVDTLGDLRINRINSQGIRAWGDSGKYVWNSPARPPIASDGKGGCYIRFGVGRLHRFNAEGNSYWSNPVQVPTSGGILRVDDTANVYLLGSKVLGYRNGQLLFTINLQKIDTFGTILWDSLGVIIDTINTNNFSGWYFLQQNSYSTIAWPQNTSGVWDLRTQIVRSDGSTVFPYRGIAVSRTTSGKGIVAVLPSDSSTSLYVWGDNRALAGIYAQRLDTVGRQLWDTNDVVINRPMFSDMVATTDGKGGCIGVGFHQFDFSIRALKVSRNGNLGEVITTIGNPLYNLPINFFLHQNYPNPFNSSTIIKYEIPKGDWVKLEVFDILGKKLKTLVDQYQHPGVYHITFDANDIASGVYVYKLQTTQLIQIKKLTIIK